MLLSKKSDNSAVRDAILFQICIHIARLAFVRKGYPFLFSRMIFDFFIRFETMHGPYLTKLAEPSEVGKPAARLSLLRRDEAVPGPARRITGSEIDRD